MIFVTIDPGLDLTGIARWAVGGQRLVLESVAEFKTAAADAFADRLHQHHEFARTGFSGVDLAVVEQPRRGGVYRRSEGKAAAVGAAMYGQNCASGALVAGLRAAGVAVWHLQPTTLRKIVKQRNAKLYLETANIRPPGRRTTWSPDVFDAVAIGLQLTSDLQLRMKVLAHATADAQSHHAPTEGARS
jgi:hypothetical protein